MKGYEVTERGKIFIAVVIVIIMITLAVIIALRAWSSSPPPSDNQSHNIEPGPDYTDTPPVIADTPLPDGSGSYPYDSEDPPGEQGSFDPSPEVPEEPDEPSEEEPDETPEEPPEPPQYGPISLNRSGGTMSFLYAPAEQDALDSDTVSMIEDFITSPRNTANARIVVEIPQLSENDRASLVSAVTEAFAKHGVAQRDLTFIANQSSPADGSYEVKISFVLPTSTGK